MAEGMSEGVVFPDVFAAIREVLDSEQERVEEQAERLKVQVDRDKAALQLRLRKALAILGPDYQEPPPRQKRGKTRSTGTKRMPAVKAKETREQILRCMIEKRNPAQSSEIREALGLSIAVQRNATKRMLADGLIRRTGSHSHTRYVVVGSGSSSASQAERKKETCRGLILEALQDRGWASPAELAQLLRLTVENIEEDAAALIAEEEIRWQRRGEVKVYVLATAV